MAEQVRASQQSQRDFLANVSHDLKTPLTSIQGFAQAITDGAAGDAESVRRSAGVIQDEAQRMSRMVSELLDLARIESGQIVMRREPVHLNAVLRDCVDKLALRAQQTGVKLNAQVPDDLPVVLGDGDRLAQVFTNLLDNALKHTPEGGKVTLAARSLSGSSIVRRGKTWPAGVEVSVSDTGSGIPPEDLGRIFERFYQVDKSRPARQRPGAGAGDRQTNRRGALWHHHSRKRRRAGIAFCRDAAARSWHRHDAGSPARKLTSTGLCDMVSAQ